MNEKNQNLHSARPVEMFREQFVRPATLMFQKLCVHVSVFSRPFVSVLVLIPFSFRCSVFPDELLSCLPAIEASKPSTERLELRRSLDMMGLQHNVTSVYFFHRHLQSSLNTHSLRCEFAICCPWIWPE